MRLTWPRASRLSLKLPLLMFAMAAVAMIATGFVAYRVAKSALVAQGLDRLEATTQARAVEVSEWIQWTLDDIAFQAENPNVVNALRSFDGAWSTLEGDPTAYLRDVFVTQNPHDAAERDALVYPDDRSGYSRNHRKYHGFFQSMARQREYEDVFLIGRDGAVFYSVFKGPDFAQTSLSPVLARAVVRAGGPQGTASVFLDFEHLSQDGAPMAHFASTIRDGGGNPIGTLVYRTDGNAIAQILRHSVGLSDMGLTYVLGRDDLVIAAFGGGADVVDIHAPTDDVLAQDLLEVDEAQWQIVTREPMSFLIAPAILVLQSIIGEAAIVLCVMALAGVFIARGIAQPMNRLRQAMRYIRDGDYTRPVPEVARRDEIGDMARTLDRVQQALRDGEAAMVDSRVKSAAMDASSAAMLVLTRDGAVNYRNQAARALLGRIGMNDDGAEVRSMLPETMRAALETGQPESTHCETVIGAVSIALGLDAICSPGGQLTGWVLEMSDVTDAHRHQAVLRSLDHHQVRLDFDPGGRIIRINEKLTGLIGQDCLGLDWQAVVHADDAGLWQNILGAATWSGHIRVVAGDGVRILRGSVSPLHNPQGDLLRLVFLGSDVTEAEEAVRVAADERNRMQANQSAVVDSLRGGLAQLSRGDLSTQITDPFSPEYEQVRLDFNATSQSLALAMRDIAQSSDTIRAQSDDISEAAEGLAAQGETQAAALQQTSMTLDQLTQNVRSAAAKVHSSSEMVAETSRNARQQISILDDAEAAMHAIQASAGEITHIVSVIDDIAFQTNLLALNAGVEAARAGEAGRGFSVVASEVRALAQRSAAAASQIDTLVQNSDNHVARGVELFRETGRALSEISQSVEQINAQMGDIANASADQSLAIAEVNETLAHIDQSTQAHVAMFERASETGRILRAQSAALSQTLKRFELTETRQAPDLMRRAG